MKKWEVCDEEGVTVLAKDKNGGFVQIVVQIPDLTDGQKKLIYGPYLKEFLLVFKKMKGVVYYSRTF